MTFPKTILVALSLTLGLGGLTSDAWAGSTIRVPQDHLTITEAIDEAVDGDTVQVARQASGPYSENVVVDKQIWLRGLNAEINAGGVGDGIQVAADNVQIDGFTIRNAGGDGISGSGSNLTISRVTVQGCAGNGINVAGDDVVIERNNVKYVGGNGIHFGAFTDSGNSRVDSNTVCLNVGTGITIQGANVSAKRNTVQYNQGNGIALDNGFYAGDTGALLEFNRVSCNSGNGICVFDTGSQTTVIQNNTLENNGCNGLEIVSGSAVEAIRNTIRKNVKNGMCITATECVLVQNRLDNNGLAGIKVDNGFGLGNHALLKNTVRSNGRDGISIQGCANDVESNTSDHNLGDGIDIVGAQLGDSPDNDLFANRCNFNQHEGIDNSGTDTIIEKNTCTRNGPGGKGVDIAGAGNAFQSFPNGVGTTTLFQNNKVTDKSLNNTNNLTQQLDI